MQWLRKIKISYAVVLLIAITWTQWSEGSSTERPGETYFLNTSWDLKTETIRRSLERHRIGL